MRVATLEWWSIRVLEITWSHQFQCSVICLANQPPVRIKRPVNEQTAPDDVYVRNRAPVTAVVAIVTVIAQGKIAVPRHRIRLIRLRQIVMAKGITPVRRSC